MKMVYFIASFLTVNFDTTEEALKAAFGVLGTVRSVTIAKKKNTKTIGKDKDKAFLSMGYGFVEYASPALVRVLTRL